MFRVLTTPLRAVLFAGCALALLVAPAAADHHEGGAMPEGMPEGMPPMGRPDQLDDVAFLLGDWDVTMSYVTAPGGPWVESAGKATSKPVLDGCAQRMDFSGEVMGMPFRGYEHLVYDREMKQYVSIWLDNMGAKAAIMRGNFDDGGALVMIGDDQMFGQKFKIKGVTKKISDDEVLFTMYRSADDGATWMEEMKMTYKRAK